MLLRAPKLPPRLRLPVSSLRGDGFGVADVLPSIPGS